MSQMFSFLSGERRAVIMMGIQASGKSTFVERCLLPHGYVHISLDILRTRQREANLFSECLAEGRSFVVDNTNPTIADRQRYIGLAKEYGYQVIGVFMQSVIKDCIARNERRENKVPTLAIPATQNKLQLPSLEQGFDALYFAKITNDGFDISTWNS